MAKKLLTSYTFTTGAENVGTVVIPGTYSLEQFLLVTNVTSGTVLYQFNVGARGGTVVSAGGYTTLTLEIDTRSMSSSDRLQVFIDDGLNPQFTLTNASVEISNDVGNPVPVDGSGVTQPVSASALPLPAGAATSANQTTANTSLSSINGKLPALSSGNLPVVPAVQLGTGVVTATTQRVTLASDGPEVTNSTAIKNSVANIPAKGAATTANSTPVNIASDQTVPVSQNIQLGMGVATSTTQRVTLATDGAAVTALASIDGKTPALVSGRQPVDGSGVTQPISATALPLPTGAATQTTLASVDGKLPALDTGYVPVLVKNGQLEITNDTGNPLPVGTAAQLNVTGSASALSADLFSTACDGYRSLCVQITGTFSGTVTIQASNDNTNWFNLVGRLITDGAGNLQATVTAASLFIANLVGFQFVRARFTAYTSGTASAIAYLSRESVPITAVSSSPTNTVVGGATSSGVTLYTANSASGTNAANIKNAAANLYGISAMNTSASTKYVRFYSKATAPTVGTDVPIMVVAIPATSSKEIEYVPALRIATGLGVAITGGAAATDSTAVAAGDVQLLVSYA